MKINWKNKGFRQVLRLLPPRSLDQGIDYFNGIVEMNLASRMGDGVMRAYQQASSLSLMPVNLIGVAISNAAFPSMTERLAEGDTQRFKRDLRSVLRWIIWLALPTAVITFFTRGFIVTFIKNGGNALIAGLLGALVVAILFRTVYHITARAFYAQQDTRTPLYVSIFSIILNISLAVLFTMKLGWGAYGLAWAQSIVAFVEVVILLTILQIRMPGILSKKFGLSIMRMMFASVLMGIITYAMVQLLQLQNNDQSFFATFPKFVTIVAVSFIVYLLICKWFNLRESDPILRKIGAILFGRIKVK
jgi:putative peptidoglycan lipid II flippase